MKRVVRSTDFEVRAQLDNIDKGGVKEVKDTAKVSGELLILTIH